MAVSYTMDCGLWMMDIVSSIRLLFVAGFG